MPLPPAEGLLIGTANLSRSVVNLPIAKQLKKRYGVNAELRNDVQIAAVGENRFGAGKGCDDFLCIFIGTGIGGAIVKNGELCFTELEPLESSVYSSGAFP